MLVERTVGGVHAHLLSIVREVGISSTTPVLDIGCGSGAWLSRLRDEGLTRLIGVDFVLPDPIPGLELRRFDINQDDSSTLGKYQFVTCIEVIEHIENVGRLLDSIKSTLAPDGVAIVTTPNIESLRARIRALVSGKIPSFDDKSDQTHLMPILCESLKKMLDRRTLQIDSVLQYPAERSRTLMFSRSVNLLSRLFSLALPDVLHGDNSIYLIRHSS